MSIRPQTAGPRGRSGGGGPTDEAHERGATFDITAFPRPTSTLVRPATAPAHRRAGAANGASSSAAAASSSNGTPFAIVTPFLARSEVFAAQHAHRTYSASRGGGRCPRNASFESAPVAWSAGPGSYDIVSRPEKHTPSFEYTAPRTDADTMREIDAARVRRHTSAPLSVADVEHVAPRPLKKHQLRGPLLSPSLAYNPLNQNRETLLRDALAAAIAAPGPPTIRLAGSDSSFSLKNSLRNGMTISGADVGARSRLPPPSGPSITDAYVPPTVRGPRAAFSNDEFKPDADDEGLPLGSQERLRQLASSGARVANFVSLNRASQATRTAAAKAARVAVVNAEIDAKRARAHAAIRQAELDARAEYESRARSKNVAARAERRRIELALAERRRFECAWLKYATLLTSVHAFAQMREDLLRERLKHFAATKIWRFYKAWKKRCATSLTHMRAMRAKQRARTNANAPATTPTTSSPGSVTRAASFVMTGGAPHTPRAHTPSPPPPISRAGSLNLPLPSFSRQGSTSLSPGSSLHPSPRISLSPRDRGGLHSLLQMQMQQASAHVLADFLEWALLDRFQRVKDAMLTFRRKARLIQRWWRRHLTSMQWRLWIQTIQFLDFREKRLAADMAERARRARDKRDAAHRNLIAAHTPAMESKRKRITGGLNQSSATMSSMRRGGSGADGFSSARSDESIFTSGGLTVTGVGEEDELNAATGEEESSRVTFADEYDVPCPATFWRGPPPPLPWRDHFTTEDRASSAKVAVRVFSHWVFDEEDSGGNTTASSASAAGGGTDRRPLRKFIVPQRAASGHLDRHAPLVQWNAMVALMRDAFAERLRLNRHAFRAWLAGERLKAMRDHLLEQSGTVRSYTEEQRERQRREAAETAATAAAKAAAATTATTFITQGTNSSQNKKNQLKKSQSHTSHRRSRHRSDSSSSGDDGGGGSSSSEEEGTDRPMPLRVASLLLSGLRSAPSSGPSSARSSRGRIHGGGGGGGGGASAGKTRSWLSSLTPPPFYRLLLNDAELWALHRGAHVFLTHVDARWAREQTSVHSVHILTRTEADGSVGAPINFGHKAALRRVVHDRLAHQAKDAREAANIAANLAAQRAAEEAAREEAQFRADNDALNAAAAAEPTSGWTADGRAITAAPRNGPAAAATAANLMASPSTANRRRLLPATSPTASPLPNTRTLATPFASPAIGRS